MLNAIRYLHQNNIVHGDIKPENIIITNDFSSYLIDFDSACEFYDLSEKREHSNCNVANVTGSLEYASPLILNENKISFSNDIYSLGYTFLNIFLNSNDIPWGKNYGDYFSEFIKLKSKGSICFKRNGDKYDLLNPDENIMKTNIELPKEIVLVLNEMMSSVHTYPDIDRLIDLLNAAE